MIPSAPRWWRLGNNPPAFDVLAWNSDATNLPAGLHADFMQMFIGDTLVTPGTATVLGSSVDLHQVKTDLYVVGALTGHIVPWQAAYAATQTFRGEVRFILSNSGHIQALVNPPGNPKASNYRGDPNPPDPQGCARTVSHSRSSRPPPAHVGRLSLLAARRSRTTFRTTA